MSLPDRDDVNDRYQWNLTRIFASPAEWNDCLGILRSELCDLDAVHPTQTPEEPTELLDRIADCYRWKQRLELYATLTRDVHTDDPAAEDRLRRFREIESTFESTMARVYRTIRISMSTRTTSRTSANRPNTREIPQSRRRSRRTKKPERRQTVFSAR